MNAITIAIIAALLATAGALVLGVGSMAHGGAFDRAHASQFMSARLVLQAVALVLLVAVLLMH